MNINHLPKVSAIITTKNRISYLRSAIESVFSQTYRNIECIVVSDNSTDGTDEYCLSRNDIHFICIPAKDSKGGNYARNLGIKAATGEYIAFLDDDDYWMPDKIQKQIDLAINKESGCIYCLRSFVNKDGTLLFKESLDYCYEGNISNKILTHYVTSTSCLLIEKKILTEVGLFDENMPKWQEYELMIRLSSITNIYCVKDYLVLYLIDSSDIFKISNKNDNLKKTIKLIRKKHKKRICNLSVRDRILFEYMILSEKMLIYKRTNRFKYIIFRCFDKLISHIVRILNFNK